MSVPMRVAGVAAVTPIPGTTSVAIHSATATTAIRTSAAISPPSVRDRLLDERPQPRPDRVHARGQELREEHRRDVLDRVDVERGAGQAAPGVLAGAGE